MLVRQTRQRIWFSEWTVFQRLTFPFSGWSRRHLDADSMCGECYCRWAYGRWFPRRCAACRRMEAQRCP